MMPKRILQRSLPVAVIRGFFMGFKTRAPAATALSINASGSSTKTPTITVVPPKASGPRSTVPGHLLVEMKNGPLAAKAQPPCMLPSSFFHDQLLLCPKSLLIEFPRPEATAFNDNSGAK